MNAPIITFMIATKLGLFDNQKFSHGRSKVIRFFWILISRMFIESAIPYPNRFKIEILKFFGASIGHGLVLKTNLKIKHPWRLEIGDNCWLGEGVWIDNLVLVRLGSNVCLSQGVFLFTGNHNYKHPEFDLIVKPIVLENGVWIGAKAIVGPGVTCFSHAILTAGSATFQNLDKYSIYQGNPALFKRHREMIR